MEYEEEVLIVEKKFHFGIIRKDSRMKIKFQNPGFEHSIDSILLFQTEEQTPFWSETLSYFYPQVDKNELAMRTMERKKDYLCQVLSGVYDEIKNELDEKVILYEQHFMKYKEQIEDALSDAFETDTRLLFNDLHANLSMNPVCPRFLRERYFDLFYKNSERGALGVSLHEVIHYLWFHVWNKTFGDSYDEYDVPSLKWILSEMVVESIMSDSRLSSINPYYPRENGGCVYPYFYTMNLEGEPILDTLAKMYQQNSIADYMRIAFDYCLTHEKAIRGHIEQCENQM